MSGSETYAVAFAQALTQCANADTTVTTCFPTNQTLVYQGQFVDIVWNPRTPQFAQAGKVDIHIFRDIGDVQPSIYDAIGITNPAPGSAGVQHVPVNASWFNSEWNGIDLNDPFFFTIAPSGTIPQAQTTFRAVQTGPVPLSSSAAPASASASSVAVVSSPNPVNASSSVPVGTIVGPVVGGLALLAGLGGWLLIRRRRRAAARNAITVNLGSETTSDTHSIASEVDEKAFAREMGHV